MAGAKLTIDQACAYLGGVSRTAFYVHVRPYVPSVSVGARVVFDVEDLEAWAAQQKAMSTPARAPRVAVDFGTKMALRVVSEPLPVPVAPRPKKERVKPAQALPVSIDPELEEALSKLARRLKRMKAEQP